MNPPYEGDLVIREMMSVTCLVLCFARNISSVTVLLPLLVLPLLGFAIHNMGVPFPASLWLLIFNTHSLGPWPPRTSGGRHTALGLESQWPKEAVLFPGVWLPAYQRRETEMMWQAVSSNARMGL